MTASRTSSEEVHPPAWAESVLRVMLEPRDRDTITGDLLEEYRETAFPERGEFGARVWYIRQVASFLTAAGFVHASIRWVKEGTMFDKLAGKSLVWLIAGAVALLILLSALVRSNFGPPATLAVNIVVSVVLAGSAVISAWHRAEVRVLWRIGFVCGVLITIVLVTRLLFEVLSPVDPLERLLARARDDYSEFNYPQRWMPAAAVALILMGGGLRAAWQTGSVGIGTLAAVSGSVMGSLVYVFLVVLGNTLPLGSQDPLGNSPRDLQFFGSVPSMLIPVLAMFSTVLGGIGALFGRGLNMRRLNG